MISTPPLSGSAAVLASGRRRPDAATHEPHSSMLTRFDDYPIHQTPEPVAHPSTGDRNVYDRYFFNGYARDASYFFGAALGLYPNRRVMDAAFSIVVDGKQWALRASRLAPTERGETTVGPITVQVIEPLHVLRVTVAPSAMGLSADLTFTARGPVVEEPRFTLKAEARVVMDLTRLTQFGTWTGAITVDGRTMPVAAEHVLGCRDRSWGIRPVGEPEGGAPGALPQFFWLWAPVHFDDVCAHFDVNEDGAGRRWHANGMLVPTNTADVSRIEAMDGVSHRIAWMPGTRRASTAEIAMTARDGTAHRIVLEPLLTFQMRGLGYLDPEWGHGQWKGPDALDAQVWTLAELDPMDPRHLHVQQLVRARMGERTGLGVLEQLVIGPHAPSGFQSILDPAP
jgi:hypothetical protein